MGNFSMKYNLFFPTPDTRRPSIVKVVDTKFDFEPRLLPVLSPILTLPSWSEEKSLNGSTPTAFAVPVACRFMCISTYNWKEIRLVMAEGTVNHDIYISTKRMPLAAGTQTDYLTLLLALDAVTTLSMYSDPNVTAAVMYGERPCYSPIDVRLFNP